MYDQHGIEVTRYDDGMVDEMTDHLSSLVKTYSKEGDPVEWVRKPTEQEWAYINNDRILSKYDFRYFANRYAKIQIVRPDGSPVTVDRLGKYGFMRTQETLLKRIEADEEAMYDAFDRGESIFGLLYFIHKARQTGYTALVRIMEKQRTFFWPDTMALAASENLEMVQELYRRDKVLWTNMPWFIRPSLRYDTKDQQLEFDGVNTVTLYHQGNQHGGMGTGKGQPVTALVLTPTGWRRIGELALGDQIIGSDGTPTKIIGVFPRGIQPAFKLTFSDRTTLTCDADHLWRVRTAKDRSRKRAGRTLTTTEIFDYYKTKATQSTQLAIPMVKAVQFAVRELPIHPYLLGQLLGDGCIKFKAVSIASNDDLSFIKPMLPAGVELRPTKDGSRCTNWRLAKTSGLRNPLISTLKELGLMGTGSATKFIPNMYLFASEAQRLELLQGLLDSDGHPSGAGVEFCSVSERLADAVQFLVESLGGTATRSTKPTYRLPAHRLYIALPSGVIPFKLRRKLDRLRVRHKYPPKRVIRLVEKVAPINTVCIQVAAEDRLYVTEHCIVTHNTISVAHLTECALWDRSAANHYDNTQKILTDLYPTIPKSLNTLYVMESTAMGIGGFWYDQVEQIRAGKSRFKLFFCPWYAADQKYVETPPPNWEPDEYIRDYVVPTVRETSAEYLGYQWELTREQMYWYEMTMNVHTGRLFTFFSNYPTTIEESFQNSGNCAFDLELLKEMQKGIGPFHGAFDLTQAA